MELESGNWSSSTCRSKFLPWSSESLDSDLGSAYFGSHARAPTLPWPSFRPSHNVSGPGLNPGCNRREEGATLRPGGLGSKGNGPSSSSFPAVHSERPARFRDGKGNGTQDHKTLRNSGTRKPQTTRTFGLAMSQMAVSAA
jgi:hypothetical protein